VALVPQRCLTTFRSRRFARLIKAFGNTNFMKCFYAPNEDAVGVCKSCGRGLSARYLTEFPDGLACKGRCEGIVEATIGMINRSTKISATSASIVQTNAKTMAVTGSFFLAMGAAFWVAAAKTRGFDLGFYMGVSFIAYGGYILFRAYKTVKASNK